MTRLLCLFLALGALAIIAGCDSFGSTRVPSPGTGSYGRPSNGNYLGGGQPAIGAATVPTGQTAPAVGSGRFSSVSPSPSAWQPSGGWATNGTAPQAGVPNSGISPVGHNTQMSTPAGTAVTAPAATGPSSFQLNRMHVNDATQLVAPQGFQPVGTAAPMVTAPNGQPANPATWPNRQGFAAPPFVPRAASAATTPAVGQPSAGGQGNTATTTTNSSTDSSGLRWRSQYTPLAPTGN